MFTSVCGMSLHGVDAMQVWVEVDVGPGLPAFEIVGLPDAAVREARERVRAALRNSGCTFPAQRIVVNLAPAHTRKGGAGFDLAIALGILASSGQVPAERLSGMAFVGELALNGDVRPVVGALAHGLGAKEAGMTGMVTSVMGAHEALAADVAVYPVATLAEVVAWLRGETAPGAVRAGAPPEPPTGPDMADVKGQAPARRAFEVAAAGSHNLLMMGPPGGGKSLLAAVLPSILPPLSHQEAMEASKIHSAAGILPPGGLISRRPFRAPHHSASRSALLGGGAPVRPGEMTLAHRGVLFLDELPEFGRDVLEGLRQPLEQGFVMVARAGARLLFPSRVMLVAAANPCPCGYLGHPERACGCAPGQAAAYRARLSGPLVDRFDLQLFLAPVRYDEYASTGASESSAAVARRVASAQQRQVERSGCPNAQLTPAEVRRNCVLPEAGHRLLRRAVESFSLSLRACDRILKVSRTIADLEGSQSIAVHHLAEALQYRGFHHQAG